jgi:hypothetical protein
MQPTEKQTFDSELALRCWLISLIYEQENQRLSPVTFFQFELNHEAGQVHLDITLIFNNILPESGPGPAVYRAGSVVVTEQTLKDFRGRWSSCRAEITDNQWYNAPYATVSGQPVIVSEFIAYRTRSFIEKVQSEIFNA